MTTLIKSEIPKGIEEISSRGSRLGVGVGISGAGALLVFGLGTVIGCEVLGDWV